MRVEVLEREEIEEKMMMTPGDIVMMLNEMGGLRVQTTSPAMGSATTAGTRKMPLPIVVPMMTATALHSPRRRGRRSPQLSASLTPMIALRSE